jgi:hypothetical protein
MKVSYHPSPAPQPSTDSLVAKMDKVETIETLEKSQ